MKRKKIFLFGGAVLCLLLICWGWKAYHQERTSIQSVRSDFILDAPKLYAAYSSNEDSANKVYLGKVLEVMGKVLTIQLTDNQAVVELETGSNFPGVVNCALRSSKELPQKGDLIHLKGRCTGFLMDVTLVDAVIISK